MKREYEGNREQKERKGKIKRKRNGKIRRIKRIIKRMRWARVKKITSAALEGRLAGIP
jgi:hypothetical protein